MPKVIKDEQVLDNTWIRAEVGIELSSLGAEPTLVPLTFWLANKEPLSQRISTIGVTLTSTDDPASLAADAQSLPLIDVNFPGFMDGRGFSIGRLLRERHGFKGELRASGQIIRDQLCYLRRCGFNAFSFDDEGMDLEACLQSLHDFTDGYQPSVDQPKPLFARRGQATL